MFGSRLFGLNWPALRRRRRSRRYSTRPFFISLLIFAVLAAISWIASLSSSNELLTVAANLHTRQEDGHPECRLVRNVKDQCAFVRVNCPDHEDGLFSYLQFYYCSLAAAKPVAFVVLILWLSLLFSTIGIAASDFLCVDLSTLASILGMSESLTGVTFLAFGNGSPDVFSTFAAMRSNSGNLAIGELIGAASFITSVVAGSMALVRPFRVARRSFVRDVGYFVIAVGFSMIMLADGRLHAWEAAAMVCLYGFYVFMVVVWHWYLVRRRRARERNAAARSHFHIPDNQELDIDEEEEDDDRGVASESQSLQGASAEDFTSLERSDALAWKQDEDEDDETRNRYLAEIRDNMHVYRPTYGRRNTLNPIRPSLVGALEFQSVLSSLRKSRNIHDHPPITLQSYTDDPNARPSKHSDNRSVASYSRVDRSSTHQQFLSPHDQASSARVRAVSANDAAGLKLDTTVFGQKAPTPVQVTLSRPSVEGLGSQDLTEPLLTRIDPAAGLTASPSSSGYPSRSSTPEAGEHAQSPRLLAPPLDGFRSLNYQADASSSNSLLQVSPRGTSLVRKPSDYGSESPSSPFPPFSSGLEAEGSGAPSICLPTTTTSPTQVLHVYDHDLEGALPRPISWWPYEKLPPPDILMSTLFPTLYGWKSKRVWERALGLVSAPSVLLLTITIPVIDPAPVDYPEPISVTVTAANGIEDAPEPRIRLPEDSPLLQAHDFGGVVSLAPGRPRWDSELPAVVHAPRSESDAAPTTTKEWNRWLVVIQLFTGPFFIALIGWTTTVDSDLQTRTHLLLLPFLCSLLFSLVVLTALIVSTRHRDPSRPLAAEWRPFLAMLGFLVAIAWIATIATEVVALLKTLGVILNISDSLLGLTIFAVGNSLGDLVADITVARLGYPVMALSACFGGPMLNILLGIGLGGLYMTLQRDIPSSSSSASPPSYDIAISKVLVISGATLLLTLVGLLIIIPLNNWRMDHKIGWGLIALWTVSTLINVVAELVSPT
ncbi:hypothetical protein ASPZODRAFT_1251619 [Penicilliopsis zonata CBS 506.65]|uniref:Sodium/calcium exchanger membrane region domain-containing protein n=1 Tax=Penicilliopsis zonata CBS 506.65 TaxID=1073090 RepID=A0A1L9S762_9EURO|nr:hypothetical protein ASPZODRAFT_1251619 [Penicilliopsis zonata CBS 506.65]OJJ42992.1 hypothetical protein ASPZODRAFT_1251619 [Penicilliopsis zonata CBS 506.65]